MSIKIPLESDETLIFANSFQSDNYSLPFAIALSENALFVSKEKHFSKESWYYERIPITQIKQIYLKKERYLWVWLFSIILFLIGLFFSVVMMTNALNQSPGTRVSGVPFAILVCGIILPFVAKGRKILIIESLKGTFKWKPRLVVDKANKNRIKDLQNQIINACRQIGIKTEIEEG
jgi:hypothetical protein